MKKLIGWKFTKVEVPDDFETKSEEEKLAYMRDLASTVEPEYWMYFDLKPGI